MSIFALHRSVLQDYQDFIRAFVLARDLPTQLNRAFSAFAAYSCSEGKEAKSL